MAEQQAEHRRIVVDTPTGRREEVHSEAVRYGDRSGISGAAVAAIVVGVVALAAIVILLVLNQQQNAVNANTTAQQPPQTIIQQPAQQPPIVVQQPAPATQPAPVIINGQPAPSSGGSITSDRASNVPDDGTIQTAVDKKLSNDPALSKLGIVAMVMNGKVTLTGSVATNAEKGQAERAVRAVKGVKSVDNQISVSGE